MKKFKFHVTDKPDGVTAADICAFIGGDTTYCLPRNSVWVIFSTSVPEKDVRSVLKIHKVTIVVP
jgi:hypothetical protein